MATTNNFGMGFEGYEAPMFGTHTLTAEEVRVLEARAFEASHRPLSADVARNAGVSVVQSTVELKVTE